MGDHTPSSRRFRILGRTREETEQLARAQVGNLDGLVRRHTDTEFYLLQPSHMDNGRMRFTVIPYPKTDDAQRAATATRLAGVASDTMWLASLVGLDKAISEQMNDQKHGDFGNIIGLSFQPKAHGSYYNGDNFIRLNSPLLNDTLGLHYAPLIGLHEYAHQDFRYRNPSLYKSPAHAFSIANRIANEANSFAYQYAAAYAAKVLGQGQFWDALIKMEGNRKGTSGETYAATTLGLAANNRQLDAYIKKNGSVPPNFLTDIKTAFLRSPSRDHIPGYLDDSVPNNGNNLHVTLRGVDPAAAQRAIDGSALQPTIASEIRHREAVARETAAKEAAAREAAAREAVAREIAAREAAATAREAAATAREAAKLAALKEAASRHAGADFPGAYAAYENLKKMGAFDYPDNKWSQEEKSLYRQASLDAYKQTKTIDPKTIPAMSEAERKRIWDMSIMASTVAGERGDNRYLNFFNTLSSWNSFGYLKNNPPNTEKTRDKTSDILRDVHAKSLLDYMYKNNLDFTHFDKTRSSQDTARALGITEILKDATHVGSPPIPKEDVFKRLKIEEGGTNTVPERKTALQPAPPT